MPSVADLEHAKQLLLEERLGDFPFVSASSRAHMVAAALTPLVRELAPGPAPLLVIESPKQATGKGLLAETLGMIVGGSAPGVMVQTRELEEERKRITAVLRDSPTMVLMDNVKFRLDSPVLAAVLTTTLWRDRTLGGSTMCALPQRALWVATGNNVQMDGEISRRAILCRIDARRDRPWERTGFRHERLAGWVGEQRHELLWALLVLVQYWVREGQPGWHGRAMGSFEGWCQTVGGILSAAGIGGFLENVDDMYEGADSETEEWRALCEVWWERFGGASVGEKDLVGLVTEGELLPGLVASVRGEVTSQRISIRLGQALKERRSQTIGQWILADRGKDAHSKAKAYGLDRAESEGSVRHLSADSPQVWEPDPASAAESAESAESDPAPDRTATPPANRVAGESCEGMGDDSPQSPHFPQADSRSRPEPAESAGDRSSNPPHGSPQPHRCLKCGLALSVVARGDHCGRCLSRIPRTRT